MSHKLDEYTDVLIRLLHETMACTPQEWSKSTLSIQCDGMRLEYQLKNEDEPGRAVISEKLRALIEEFYVRMADGGKPWSEAVIDTFQEGTKTKFETTFKYDDGKTPAPAPVAPPTKPRWKLW